MRGTPAGKVLDGRRVERVDPDGDAIELARRGELHAAVTLLMRRYGRAVYRFCRAALHDDARADDVHQRVFVEAHRDLPRFAGRSLLKTWLFTIARHRVLDDARATDRAHSHVERDDAGEVADPAPTADQRLDDAQLHEALVACVGLLPEPTRIALLLRYQQDLTFEEMEEICGEKAGTLQARVARAFPALRAMILERTGGSV